MKRKKLRYYWDTNCFIALINKEMTTKEVYLNAIVQTYEDMISGCVEIITSDVILSEILLPEKEKKDFINALKSCPHFELVEPRTKTYEFAGELRQKCKDQSVHIPKNADSIHIASAILFGVTEFWTTERDLISLYERKIITELIICNPRVLQPRLQF